MRTISVGNMGRRNMWRGVSLHPDFDLDDFPGWVCGVGGGE